MPDPDLGPFIQTIETRFPQIQVRTAVPIQAGWSSFVLEVNAEYMFRFPRRPEIVPGLLKESALLPELAGALSVAVPRFEYIWLPEEGGRSEPSLQPVNQVDAQSFVGYRKISGEALHVDIVTPALIAHLAAVLGELHAFPVSRAAELGIPGGSAADWRQEYQETYDWVQRLVCPLLSQAEQDRVTAGWEAFLDGDAHFRFRPALVHRDLGPEHILCDPAAGRVNGIIDWEDASIGDPAIDFTGLLMDCGADFARQVLARYPGPVDETLWARAEFYAWIGPVYEIRFGLESEQQEHLENGLEEMKQTLIRYERYGQQP